MTGGRRLFVGVRVSVGTANALAGAAETLARRARDAGIDLRWVAPLDYHVTIKFLGWTRDATMGALGDALREAVAGLATRRLSFKTTRLGAFPSLDKATVLWAGIEERSESTGGGNPAGFASTGGGINESGGLAELAARIEAATAALGFAAERRAFHPHVTLGRLREARPLREVVLPLAEQMFGESRLETVSLFESETKSSGSVYRELSKISLGKPEIAPISSPERQTAPLQQGASNRSHEPDTDDGWPRGQGPNHDP